ncbi:unnamed protein product [Penicillium egyptiacum]|uniref:Mitochondrial mRNA processing protein PET127 n=1 Tax=Penicillium egyptiacum TaxID=1303716 RepID=A0A9W4K8A7_9EURO|nr:unnamed protein product [Penicillium egyptiacum]
MLRTSLRSVSGPLSRHVCLSCLPRPGAPSLRQFHHISALRTNIGEIKPETNSLDASTEPSVPLPPNGQIPETKDAASSEPQKPQPLQAKPIQLTASEWAEMNVKQKRRYKFRHKSDFEKFRNSMLANRDITLPEAVKLEMERVEAAQSGAAPSDAAPSEPPSNAASSEAARVEAEKIKAFQQKVTATDVEARQERRVKHKEGKKLANAKIGTQMKEKEKESEPEAEVPTDGPSDTPAFSEPKKSMLNLQSTSNVVDQILEASSKNGEEKEEKKKKKSGEDIEDHITSDDRGSLSSMDRKLHLKAVPVPMPPVPRVAFGLDRVLFNPGVYQLRDPRTLVYNFDPYLDQIMPVTEFDFDTLKPYITSSQDVTACEMTKKHGKKYYGSSSSMTSVLAHFHYLLSAWRPVDTSKISRGFDDPTQTFTRLLRAPAAMFLRYKEDEDVYAIDADKEYDYANILMNLGKSMEKQLTLPKDQFERYRRSDPNKITAEEEAAVPESYHYSTAGKFLMRSQLDAYDPRLPGTGMFDLKTRAAVSIRMESTDHKRGMGYEIRRRFGKWESFEREYFDMIRAAFLKYSLQVRIGRMDGIFVAYHNIDRIFGFQYIPLSEMDQALHSSPTTTLGNKEFELSLGLWEKIMDKATQRFPKQSLRFHFETRGESKEDIWMNIVAQPVTSDEIDAIQTKNKAHIDAIQDRLLNPDQFVDTDYEKAAVGEEESLYADEESSETDSLDPEEESAEFLRSEEESTETDPFYPAEKPTETEPFNGKEDPSAPSLADVLFPKEEGEEECEETYDTSFELPDLEPITPAKTNKTKTVPKRDVSNLGKFDENLLGMKVVVDSKINGESVRRPGWMTDTDDWSIDYELTELDVKESNELLRGCKRRRNNALRKNVTDHDHFFFSTLKKVTDRGRRYRKRLEEKDRERGILVYQDSYKM